VIDHEPVAMARTLADVDLDKLYREAWTEGSSEGVQIEALRPETVQEFLAFLRDAFPGDWNTAARSKLRSGPMDEVLIARLNGTVVGYCQWEGEHFGPTGVQAEARGKRLGAKLFVEAMRRIRLAGGNSIWFNWADPDAARFYHRFGLEVTRRYAILRKDL
jgi:predicted N-acetyltransferase YhbS